MSRKLRKFEAIRTSSFVLLAILSLGSNGCAQNPSTLSSEVTYSRLIALDEKALAITAQRIHAKNPAAMSAFTALQLRADKALLTPLRSVVNKTLTPPSGSKNDYMSMGPYWWPNPATASGLPYVQRDGQINPEAKGDALDSLPMVRMGDDCLDLALAYRFTGDVRYATKAAEVIRAWFLTSATRMNPSLRFAQGIPGVVEGRGTGLLDTRYLWMVMDSMALIGPALTPAEAQGMRKWFAEYTRWFETSDLGQDEAAAKNNHGMFYDMQLVALWLFLGETERARERVFNAQTTRFAAQIDKNGLMPLELARTRPYHYHTFTLEAATQLARFGQVISATPNPEGQWQASDSRCKPPQLHIQCPLDLWNVTIDGKSLRGVLDTVAEVVVNPSAWKYPTELETAPVLAPALPVLLMAQRAYPPGTYSAALSKLQGISPNHVAWLLWPAP